ncbi:DNA-directed RNA polymerase subunit beta' [Castilleja foliolosa]|uniref:DNA-directed RNA polymerase subunit n=1 Tax=Castilleja foliolosa TaxID=1961234 RepID=A0ABD3B6Z0_9LAMI
MEVWALEGFGVAHILQEMLTYKSDHIRARQEVLGTTIIEEQYPILRMLPNRFGCSFENYDSLRLELNHFLVSEKNFQINRKEAYTWAAKILPNGEIVGEVTKPYTFHYKTNKPEKDGLFCERIFGPIKSGICACGNYRVIGDEKEDPKVLFEMRNCHLQSIQLGCPGSDMPLRSYPNFSFARPITKKPTFLRLRGLFEYEIQSWKYSIPLFFTTRGFDTFRNREISTGAGAIREQLADLDLRIILDNSLVEWKELGEEGPTGNEWEDRKVGRRKDFLVRRMELAKHFLRTNIEPEWMVLCLLPVLPPELRPIIQIDGGKLMSSDINELYRRVIYRNNTLTDLLTTSRSTPGELVMCQEKLVQEAVDTLLDNGIRGQPMRDGHNKVYKSFSDVIEGKEGRFRETLLGKRVDYSGRSVIVVGPSLSLHRCGLPREIAIELFQTFVIRGLIRQHLASNIGVAKSKIREKDLIVWKYFRKLCRGIPF